MKRLIVTVFVMCALVVPASAQFSTFNDSSGNSGTIYNYGNGFQSYQDSQGNSGTIYNYGNGFQGYQFNGPSGPTSGSIYTYPNTAPAPYSAPQITPIVPQAPAFGLAPFYPTMPSSPYGRPSK